MFLVQWGVSDPLQFTLAASGAGAREAVREWNSAQPAELLWAAEHTQVCPVTQALSCSQAGLRMNWCTECNHHTSHGIVDIFFTESYASMLKDLILYS